MPNLNHELIIGYDPNHISPAAVITDKEPQVEILEVNDTQEKECKDKALKKHTFELT